MKYYLTILLLVIICCSITSCKKDFLDVENTQNLYRQSYVKDLNTMNDFVNGIYVSLTYIFEQGMGGAYPELIADNLKPFSAAANIMITHYSWVQQTDGIDNQNFVGVNANSKAMDPYWRSGYKVIRACNFVLEDIDKYRDQNPEMADGIKGQVLGIRAYVYFKLVNTFAQCYKFTADATHPGVPYITTSDVTKPYTRQTVAEVYSNMIADLNNAIQLLSATVTDTRFMNSIAAKALMARIYLFKEDFTEAKNLATEIASQVPLMTKAAGYPNDLFKLKAPSKTESLFQLTPQSSAYVTNFINRYLRSSPIRFVATSDIAGILKENLNDARNVWITNTSGQWLVTKFPTASAPEVTPVITPAEIAYYPAVFRSSEMFLTVAEASAKTGDENTARTFLNAIRKRANPLTAEVTAVGPALLDSIYKERRKEFAFESLRMYDLQRWKIGVHRTDALFSTAKDLPYPSDKAIAPIPFNDFKLADIPQNSSY